MEVDHGSGLPPLGAGGEDGWDRYYRTVIRETGREAEERLHRFGESARDWVHGLVNWPPPNWPAELDLLVEHTRYYGLVIEPECVRNLHNLIEARINGTGPFEVLGPYGSNAPEGGGPVVQLALGVGLDEGATTGASSGTTVSGAGASTSRLWTITHRAQSRTTAPRWFTAVDLT